MRFSLLPGLIIVLCLLMTACTFDHLTNIKSDDTTAPSAEECGSCHVEQYAEWKGTAHARAFISEEFKSQSDDYQDKECLFCHIPGAVLSDKRKARNYNRNEGVTCVSCHLFEQTMHGPHTSGALFSPHPIVQDSKVDSQLESSQLCGVCHEDTYLQWRQQRTKKEYPTCHGCHGSTVKRTATKGTNFFSKLLVSFETEHSVQSHHLILAAQVDSEFGPDLKLDRIENDTLYFSLLNNLPHDLPTGNFAEKELFLHFQLQADDNLPVEQKKIAVNVLLAPGERYTFTLFFPHRGEHAQLSAELFREDIVTGKSNLIHSYTFPLTHE